MDKPQRRQKAKIGTVIGKKMRKTVSVTVERPVKHPLYKKYLRKRKKFLAHDEYEKCKIGDKVKIVETRPLSKRKKWRVQQIVGLTQSEEKK